MTCKCALRTYAAARRQKDFPEKMSEGTKLVGVIGDEDTVTGFILAGVGHRTAEGTNFLVVKPSACSCCCCTGTNRR